MTADQLIFVNSNCGDTKNISTSREPLILLCGTHENSVSSDSSCQCPTAHQLMMATKSELAKTNILLETGNNKMICTNYSQSNVFAVARLLIPIDEDVTKFDTYGNTLLILSRFYANDNLIELVKKLISSNASSVTATTTFGSSALMVLSAFSNSDQIVQVAELLIESGAVVEKKGKHNYNALMALCEFSTSDKIVQLAELLISKGINLNEKDEGGRNTLSVLCHNSYSPKILQVAKLLITNGISVNQIDKDGKTAFDYMNDRSVDDIPNKTGILQLLEEQRGQNGK